MSEILLHFVHEKSTKNTERFKEQTAPGQEPIIGTLYVRRSQLLNLHNPTALTVTIRSATPDAPPATYAPPA